MFVHVPISSSTHRWQVKTSTADVGMLKRHPQTKHSVTIDMLGTQGASGTLLLENHNKSKFKAGQVDTFVFDVGEDIGDLRSITVSMCDLCVGDGWLVDDIVVTNLDTSEVYTFHVNEWLKITETSTSRKSVVVTPGKNIPGAFFIHLQISN